MRFYNIMGPKSSQPKFVPSLSNPGPFNPQGAVLWEGKLYPTWQFYGIFANAPARSGISPAMIRSAIAQPQISPLSNNNVLEISDALDLITNEVRKKSTKDLSRFQSWDEDDIWFAPAVAPAASVRDFYAFEEHGRNARRQRGLEIPPEWYRFPVFYFSNHRALIGHEWQLPAPEHGQWLDFELEIACVIGRQGRNIATADVEQYTAGYSILNDWSLRDLQQEEVKVGLGPAKGKDFATSLGPYLVTPDELADRRSGKGYDLAMTARVNGREVSRGNWCDIHYSFAEMIARASQGVTLYPGDVLGSGTVGTGCLLETGTHFPDGSLIGSGPDGWLGPGDVVELEVERLGVLGNQIVSPGSLDQT